MDFFDQIMSNWRLTVFCIALFLSFDTQAHDEMCFSECAMDKKAEIVADITSIIDESVILLAVGGGNLRREARKAFPSYRMFGTRPQRMIALLVGKCGIGEREIVYVYPGEWETNRLVMAQPWDPREAWRMALYHPTFDSLGENAKLLFLKESPIHVRPELFSRPIVCYQRIQNVSGNPSSDKLQEIPTPESLSYELLLQDPQKWGRNHADEYAIFTNRTFQINGFPIFLLQSNGAASILDADSRPEILCRRDTNPSLAASASLPLSLSSEEVSELTYLALLQKDADTAEARYKDRLARYPEYLRPVDGGHLRTELGRMLLEQMSLPPRPAQATAVDALPAPEEPMRTPPPSPDSSTDRP